MSFSQRPSYRSSPRYRADLHLPHHHADKSRAPRSCEQQRGRFQRWDTAISDPRKYGPDRPRHWRSERRQQNARPYGHQAPSPEPDLSTKAAIDYAYSIMKPHPPGFVPANRNLLDDAYRFSDDQTLRRCIDTTHTLLKNRDQSLRQRFRGGAFVLATYANYIVRVADKDIECLNRLSNYLVTAHECNLHFERDALARRTLNTLIINIMNVLIGKVMHCLQYGKDERDNYRNMVINLYVLAVEYGHYRKLDFKHQLQLIHIFGRRLLEFEHMYPDQRTHSSPGDWRVRAGQIMDMVDEDQIVAASLNTPSEWRDPSLAWNARSQLLLLGHRSKRWPTDKTAIFLDHLLRDITDQTLPLPPEAPAINTFLSVWHELIDVMRLAKIEDYYRKTHILYEFMQTETGRTFRSPRARQRIQKSVLTELIYCCREQQDWEQEHKYQAELDQLRLQPEENTSSARN